MSVTVASGDLRPPDAPPVITSARLPALTTRRTCSSSAVRPHNTRAQYPAGFDEVHGLSEPLVVARMNARANADQSSDTTQARTSSTPIDRVGRPAEVKVRVAAPER